MPQSCVARRIGVKTNADAAVRNDDDHDIQVEEQVEAEVGRWVGARLRAGLEWISAGGVEVGVGGGSRGETGEGRRRGHKRTKRWGVGG